MSTSARRTARGRATLRALATSTEIETFYRELFMPLVRRAIRRHGLSNEDARDVVQETFVLALAKLDSHGNAVAWLKQVVDFTAVNVKRTAARRARILARWNGSSCRHEELGSGRFNPEGV